MQYKDLTLDLSLVQTKEDLLTQLSQIFAYTPDFKGSNIDACIDILSSLRIPEDGMTQFHLAPEQAIMLTITHANETTDNIRRWLFTITTQVNTRVQEINQEPLIYLLPQAH